MADKKQSELGIQRRALLKTTVAGAALGVASGLGGCTTPGTTTTARAAAPVAMKRAQGRSWQASYKQAQLNRLAYPMGGFGAGMICLEGQGAFSHVSLRHHPKLFNAPSMFAAISIANPGGERLTRVVEGPVPGWKIFGYRGAAWGLGGTTYGLPRFEETAFTAQFPFGHIEMTDPDIPLTAEVTGWSPFVPGDADVSSLPVAGVEYRFTNSSNSSVEAVFSFSSPNFLAESDPENAAIKPVPGGFTLWAGGREEAPWEECSLAIAVDDPAVAVNHAWFRGGWQDPFTMAWRDIEEGAVKSRPPVTEGPPASGASLSVPVSLAPGESKTIRVMLSWFAPYSDVRRGGQGTPNDRGRNTTTEHDTYKAWYLSRFDSSDAVAGYWRENYDSLRSATRSFTEAFYASTLPPEVIEAVGANLSILKSTTILRQADGRLWAWEGSGDDDGCCHGSCTHVWNYAQAMPHLFPSLERTLRETEFGPNQDEEGHQQFRAALPIREIGNTFYAAADGQLGGILKVHRDWRISGDTDWLRGLWPKVTKSLDYCIETWDPDHEGWIREPHHNTYDIEFWGPDGMHTTIYAGALQAAVLMGHALGEDVGLYETLLVRSLEKLHTDLYDGEYFIQKVQWEGLRAGPPKAIGSIGEGQVESDEGAALVRLEGPKYQYGTGCLSDGVIGEWFAQVCGVGPVLDEDKIASHVKAVHSYNFRKDLSEHANPQRPAFAFDEEGGLLLCSWPKGGMPSLPFVYSNEVWTGIEYQVASHLMFTGHVEEGLEIVRTARARYDGRIRNPFNEIECGNFYARALSSYALLEGMSGARYDAVDKTLHLHPRVKGDFQSFLSTASGYGLVGVRGGEPFVDVRHGRIDVENIDYRPAV